MLKQWINQKVAGGVIRHVMTVLGGMLMASGHTDAATWEIVTGGAVAAAGIGFSIIEKQWRF